ncbi:MAG TPA: dihydroorotase [Gammaproteobacteria bacterium]|nr:dihydroorotase [Gammaproteobacteria bacterium]
MKTITLTKPDDWHIHLRDGMALKTTVRHAAEQFARAIIMPNLQPPVTTTEAALAYRQRILDAIPADKRSFKPLMTLYLTDHTSADEIKRAHRSGHVVAAKLYPAGATTNSAQGVTRFEAIYEALEAMAELNMPLLVHGEVTDSDVDVFDREKVFIETKLIPLVNRFPHLRIVLEHITTADAVEFITSSNENIAATMTAHHLLLNRNAMLVGGIHPHYYCLPVVKRERHRLALLEAATSGSSKFFLGTDSAPHIQGNKESACGCAGIYTAHAAIELYAEAFDSAGALDKLEGFASFYGPDFYGLSRNEEKIRLGKESSLAPDQFDLGGEPLIPFRAGAELRWKRVE